WLGYEPVKHIGHNWSQVSVHTAELSCRIEGYMASRDLYAGHGLASLGSEPEKNGGLYQTLRGLLELKGYHSLPLSSVLESFASLSRLKG
ncbi:hypothetical protein Bca52824_095688, partial [Brassica carinata]